MTDRDRELILKIRKGENEAFKELVTLYQKRIFFAAYRLVRNYEDAIDITQETFIAAYQAIKGFRLHSSFYTWIYRIAVNLCYRKFKSSQYRVKLKTLPFNEELNPFPAGSKDDPYQIIFSREQERLIHKALAVLKRKFYQVVVLHDLEGFSYKEIGKILHCSDGTVMSRLHRARAQLARIFKKME